MSDILQRILISAQSTADAVFQNLSSVATLSFTDIESATASLDGALSTLDSSLAGVDASLSGLDASAGGLDASLASIDASASGAGAALDAVAASTAALDSSLSGVDGSLAAVDASAAGADGTLTGMEAVLAAMQGSIDALTGAIGVLTGSVDALAASVAASDAALAGEAATADTATASMTALAASQKIAAGMGNLLSNLKMPALLAGAALLAIGIASVKMSGDFQSGITTLMTGAGELKANLALVAAGILQIAVATGTSTKQLISGMFQIESAGYHGAAGLHVLQIAAEGAKVGNADLSTVANAVTTVMNDYGIKAGNAAQAMNFLTGIVQNGKTTLQQLASSMSSVLPTASAVGVKLIDVGGAMATMTGEGVPAANAATYLRQMLVSLSSPASGAVAALKNIGLTTQQVSNEMKISLPGTLQLIMDHINATYTQGSPAWMNAVKTIAGGSKQMQGFLDLTGTHLSTFKQNVLNVSGVMQKGGQSVTGWTAVQKDFNTQIDQAKAVVEVLFIQLGTQLAPVFGRLVAGVVPLLKNFATWESQTHFVQNAITLLIGVIGNLISAGAGILSFFASNHVALVALGVVLVIVAGAIAGALVAAFVAWAIAAWAAAIATLAAAWPILLIGAIVALVVAGIILAITHWGAIVAWLGGIWSAFASWFGSVMSAIGTFFRGVWDGIATFFVGVWNHIIAFLQAAWAVIVNVVKVAALVLLAVIIGPIGLAILYIITHWTQVQQFLANIWNAIVSLAKTVWNAIVGAISAAIQTVVGWFSWLYNHNYYFANLVNFIRNLFTALGSWLSSTWQAIVSWITSAWQALLALGSAVWNAISTAIQTAVQAVWNWLVAVWTTISSWLSGIWLALSSLASSVWNAITSAISAAVTTAWNFIVSVWTQVVSFLSGIWNTITTDVGNLWSKISSIFGGAWSTYIAGPLSSLWNNFSSWFGNLASQALQWGANLLQGFINGITSMIGNLKSALGNVMSTIAGWLGFHSPTKEGEGRFIIQWGQNMLGGFSQGVVEAIPQLQAAVNLAMQPVKAEMGTPASAGPAQIASGGGGTHYHHNSVTVQVSGQRSKSEAQEIADTVEARMTKKYKANNGNAWHGGSW